MGVRMLTVRLHKARFRCRGLEPPRLEKDMIDPAPLFRRQTPVAASRPILGAALSLASRACGEAA